MLTSSSPPETLNPNPTASSHVDKPMFELHSSACVELWKAPRGWEHVMTSYGIVRWHVPVIEDDVIRVQGLKAQKVEG